jgi:hypothetical protein
MQVFKGVLLLQRYGKMVRQMQISRGFIVFFWFLIEKRIL